jgi:hypothetical protein
MNPASGTALSMIFEPLSNKARRSGPSKTIPVSSLRMRADEHGEFVHGSPLETIHFHKEQHQEKELFG